MLGSWHAQHISTGPLGRIQKGKEVPETKLWKNYSPQRERLAQQIVD